MQEVHCSLYSFWPAGNVLAFNFHGFIIRKLLEEEVFMFVCEVAAIHSHADLS